MTSVAEQELEAPDSTALLARCRQNDERAWRELFDAHFEFVWAVARRLGTPQGELDDVCQEVFVVVFKKLADFTHGRFTTWLYRIVANVVSDRHRKRRFRDALRTLAETVLPAALAPAQTPEAAMHERESEAQVNKVLERMAPKKREVFALYELEALSGEEIAERVGCKVDTVWTRLHYARKDFERIAGELGIAQERSA